MRRKQVIGVVVEERGLRTPQTIMAAQENKID
jgi:hypothetical protein